MTKIIGLTGGIGSGKSSVAKIFHSFGVPIYYSDEQAKTITNKPETLAQIKNIFGSDVFENGTLDRKKLGNIVFNNSGKLLQLNAIIHPLVKIDFEEWLQTKQTFPFVIKESALLIETKDYKNCDFVITVITSLENRIKRVMKRDNISKMQVLQRINNQLPDESRIIKSNFIINNDIRSTALKEIDEIYKTILKSYS